MTKEQNKITTVMIYSNDLSRLNKLRRERINRQKYERRMETSQELIGRAVTALEEKERNSQ